MKLIKLLILGTALISFVSCSKDDNKFFSYKDGGSILGGIGGAFLGAQVGGGTGQIVTIAAGTLLGAYLGNKVGEHLDNNDMAFIEGTSQYALEHNRSGVASNWENNESGNSGSVIPNKTYTKDDTYCRDYTQTVKIGDKAEEANGTACREKDGTWKLSN